MLKNHPNKIQAPSIFLSPLFLMVSVLLSSCQQGVTKDAIVTDPATSTSSVENISPEEIKDIDTYVKSVDYQLRTSRVCKEKIMGMATDYTSIVSYYDGDVLVKISASEYFESGKTDREIYFKNRDAVYVDEMDYQYKIKESDHEIYSDSSEVESKTPSQLYLNNNKLALLIGNGTTIDPKMNKYSSKAKEWQDEYATLKLDERVVKKNCPVSEKNQDVGSKVPDSKKSQAVEIQKCLNLSKKPADEELGYLDKDFNESVKESGWVPASKILEGQVADMGIRLWSGSGVKYVMLETSTPSGDWMRYDDYCFDESGKTVNLDSELRTFYGHIRAVRKWWYLTDGTPEGNSKEIFDLKSSKPIEPYGTIYEDRPPYLAKGYKDLLDHLELPTSKR